MSQIASFYLIKITSGRSCPTVTAPARSIWPSGTGVRANWIWMSVFLLPRRKTPWTALCWRRAGVSTAGSSAGAGSPGAGR